MKYLKILVWNDKPEHADRWQEVIADCEPVDTVLKSTASVSDEVVQVFEAAKPDLVVLDIKGEGDKKMGLDIAEGIRQLDLLVPILAVTREPRIVYLATDRSEKLGFAGIFHASIMEEGVFECMALRPSLYQWHLIVPEFPLVRYCIQGVRAAFGTADPQFANEFTEMLQSLPFSGSIESWHTQIRNPLVRFMERRDLRNLANRFKIISELFEQADPFYMAGSRSRRHLSHNVQVFLMGLAVLLSCEPIREAASVSLRAHHPELSDPQALLDAILIWSCIANTHDVAYLSEHLSELTEQLEAVTQTFSTVFLPSDHVRPIPKTDWPHLPHGEVAARLWRAELPTDTRNWNFENHYFELVAAAIARHDSRTFQNSPVGMDDWAQFLAVLSDELQDWGRERLNNPPGPQPFESVAWGMFSLEGIQVTCKNPSSNPEWLLALTFVARDHPEIIAARFGTSGEETVRTTIARIAQTLRANLRSERRFALELNVEFVSRPDATAVHEPVAISRP